MQDIDPWRIWVISGALAAGILGGTAFSTRPSIDQAASSVSGANKRQVRVSQATMSNLQDSSSLQIPEYVPIRSLHAYTSRVFSPVPISVVAALVMGEAQSDSTSSIGWNPVTVASDNGADNVTGEIAAVETANQWAAEDSDGDANQALVAYNVPVNDYGQVTDISSPLGRIPGMGVLNGPPPTDFTDIVTYDSGDLTDSKDMVALVDGLQNNEYVESQPAFAGEGVVVLSETDGPELASQQGGNLDGWLASNETVEPNSQDGQYVGKISTLTASIGSASPQQVYAQQMAALAMSRGNQLGSSQQAAAQQAMALALLSNSRGGTAAQQYQTIAQSQQYQQPQVPQGGAVGWSSRISGNANYNVYYRKQASDQLVELSVPQSNTSNFRNYDR